MNFESSIYLGSFAIMETNGDNRASFANAGGEPPAKKVSTEEDSYRTISPSVSTVVVLNISIPYRSAIGGVNVGRIGEPLT